MKCKSEKLRVEVGIAKKIARLLELSGYEIVSAEDTIKKSETKNDTFAFGFLNQTPTLESLEITIKIKARTAPLQPEHVEEEYDDISFSDDNLIPRVKRAKDHA